MEAYNSPAWVWCPASAHKTRKKPNCSTNPHCVFGFGVETKEAGIWNPHLERNVLGPDPADELKVAVADDAVDGNSSKKTTTASNKPTKASESSGGTLTRAPSKTGLRNLGATCYINCLLQTLFHNQRFRRSIYEWRRPKAEFIAEMTASMVKQLDILEALQLLFGRMHLTSYWSVSTLQLVELLGVSKTVQQDVQEFNKLLLAFIDNALSKTAETHRASTKLMAEAEAFEDKRVARRSKRRLEAKAQEKVAQLAPQLEMARLIPAMFSGMLVRRTTCKGCVAAGRAGQSDRREEYYDLALQIQGCGDLESCLERYFLPEDLTGDNKYFCEACGSKQDAQRTTHLDSNACPETLTLQLMRFIYDRVTWSKVKVNDAIQLPRRLCLSKFMLDGGGADATEQAEHTYELKVVMYHIGKSTEVGHYVADIFDPETSTWFHCDDDVVSVLPNAGGVSVDVATSESSSKASKSTKGRGVSKRKGAQKPSSCEKEPPTKLRGVKGSCEAEVVGKPPKKRSRHKSIGDKVASHLGQPVVAVADLTVEDMNHASPISESPPVRKRGRPSKARSRASSNGGDYDEEAALKLAMECSLREAQDAAGGVKEAKTSSSVDLTSSSNNDIATSPARRSARKVEKSRKLKEKAQAQRDLQSKVEEAERLRNERLVSNRPRGLLHAAKGSQTAYMLMYQRVGGDTCKPSKLSPDLLPRGAVETVQTQNRRIEQRAQEYARARSELNRLAEHRRKTYSKRVVSAIKAARAAASSHDCTDSGAPANDDDSTALPNSHHKEHRWVSTRCFRDWVAGQDIIEHLQQTNSVARSQLSNPRSGDTVWDLSEDSGPSAPSTTSRSAVAETAAVEVDSDVVNLVEGCDAVHREDTGEPKRLEKSVSVSSDVHALLCEHGKVKPQEAARNFKRLPLAVYKEMFEENDVQCTNADALHLGQDRRNFFTAQYLSQQAPSIPEDFECGECGREFDRASRIKRRQAESYEQILTWMDTLSSRSKKKDWEVVGYNSPQYRAVRINPRTGQFRCCWLSKTWVTKFKNFARAYVDAHGNETENKAKSVTVIDKLRKAMQETPPDNPNEELVCEHGRLRPGFKAKAMLVPEHLWVSIQAEFPNAQRFIAKGAAWAAGDMPLPNPDAAAVAAEACSLCSQAATQTRMALVADRKERSAQRSPPSLRFLYDKQTRGVPAKSRKVGHDSTTVLEAGQQYVFVPHRWLMKWRSFVAGDSDPPDTSMLAIVQRDHVHEVTSPRKNGNQSPPGRPFFVPPPYVLEYLGGNAAEKAVIPKYGFAGKVGKAGSSKSNETIFNTFRQVEGLPIPSLEVVHYEAVFGVVSPSLSQDDSPPAAAVVKQKGLAHFYPDADWDQLPTVSVSPAEGDLIFKPPVCQACYAEQQRVHVAARATFDRGLVCLKCLPTGQLPDGVTVESSCSSGVAGSPIDMSQDSSGAASPTQKRTSLSRSAKRSRPVEIFVPCSSTDTVAQLLLRATEFDEGFDPERADLFCNGQRMDVITKTLQSYGVLQDSVVEVARSDAVRHGRSIAALLGDGSGDANSSSQGSTDQRIRERGFADTALAAAF